MKFYKFKQTTKDQNSNQEINKLYGFIFAENETEAKKNLNINMFEIENAEYSIELQELDGVAFYGDYDFPTMGIKNNKLIDDIQ
jgi:hypothetical protein